MSVKNKLGPTAIPAVYRAISPVDLPPLGDLTREGLIVVVAGRIEALNRAAACLFGYEVEQLINQDIQTLLEDYDLVDVGDWIGSTGLCRDMTGRHRQGYTFVLEVFVRLFESAGPARILFTLRERHHQEGAEQALRLSEQRFKDFADSASDWFWEMDADLRFSFLSGQLLRIAGVSRERVLGKRREELMPIERMDDSWRQHLDDLEQHRPFRDFRYVTHKDNGELLFLSISGKPIFDHGVFNGYRGTGCDITEKKVAEMHIQHLAYYDGLTNLPNRQLLNDRLGHALNRARRLSRKVALMFLDLDRFKGINDTLGHPAGDDLLREVARRLLKVVRREDTVARLGGDEFTLILEDAAEVSDIIPVVDKVLEVLHDPIRLGAYEAVVTGSVGISVYPDDGEDIHTLLKNADTAMYQAKAQGRNGYQFYTQAMSDRARQRLSLESALRVAIQQHQFELYYQPLIDLVSAEVVGAEALIRWRHPQRGVVAPQVFIPLAEDIGLINDIGEWVLASACRQLREWQLAGHKLNRVAVNISGYELVNSDLVGNVERVLQETELPPQCLELEITESYIMSEPERCIHILDQLKRLGVGLAIDDFGTGHSSLSYLKRFPIQKLKIDRSFVQDIPQDKNDEAIVRAVLALGRSLQLQVVAEGIETDDQRQFLAAQGCELGQGYLFGRPMPAKAFIRHINTLERHPGRQLFHSTL